MNESVFKIILREREIDREKEKERMKLSYIIDCVVVLYLPS